MVSFSRVIRVFANQEPSTLRSSPRGTPRLRGGGMRQWGGGTGGCVESGALGGSRSEPIRDEGLLGTPRSAHSRV
eukprot:1025836-Prorocentrum_minimum.AAC.1